MKFNTPETKQLAALRDYLKPMGTVTIESRTEGVLNEQQTRLTYSTQGLVPFTWPVTGAAEMSFVYSESNTAWTCAGTLFGQTPTANTPKAWFHDVASGVVARERRFKAFFQQAMTYWERYVGDMEQFQYRLGIQLASMGHMERYADGFVWRSANDSTLQVFFSKDVVPPTFGMPPSFRFGFFDAPATHKWSLTLDNMSDFAANLAKFATTATEFCKGASACFGVTDYSDVPAA